MTEAYIENVLMYKKNPSLLDEGSIFTTKGFLALSETAQGNLRHFPEHLESFADSFLMKLLVYLSTRRGEKIIADVTEFASDKMLDSEWSQAKTFFQGLLRGIFALEEHKPLLVPCTKAPYRQGLWYVQGHALKKHLKRSWGPVMAMPVRSGLFQYTSKGGKGLTLAESIATQQLIHSVLDQLEPTIELWKYILKSPETLCAEGVLRHKKPWLKTALFFPAELSYLQKVQEQPFQNAHDKIRDIYKNISKYPDDLDNYAESVILCNRNLAREFMSSTRQSAIRSTCLFKKGMKGDFNMRVESLSMEEFIKFFPNWCIKVLITPPTIPDTRSESSVKLFFDSLQKTIQKIGDNDERIIIKQWLEKLPIIEPRLRGEILSGILSSILI
jgi:hypothetical protein